MCGLCQLQSVFGDPVGAHDPLDAIKERAVRVKRLIRLHEKVIQKHDDDGSPTCNASVKRLAALRGEQFELARQL